VHSSILAGSWEWVLAEKHYTRAIELIPNDQAADCWYSQSLADAGRFDDAIEEAWLNRSPQRRDRAITPWRTLSIWRGGM
jgi:hypothetical protein